MEELQEFSEKEESNFDLKAEIFKYLNALEMVIVWMSSWVYSSLISITVTPFLYMLRRQL